MAKLNGKPLWIVRDATPDMEPADEENVWNSPYGDPLINQIRGTSHPWSENWTFYDNEREARADAKKRMAKVHRGRRATGPDYERRQG